MTINQKLTEIQTRFKSKKSRFNSFGKYYFRSAEDILEATKPFLKELNVTVTINEELTYELISIELEGSKNIIAINKDANAPIFEIADYAVIGDLLEIIPKLIEKI